MSNPLKDYKDAVRAALPSGITFASDVARYFYNAVPRSRETRYSEIKRYRDYILKTSGFGIYAVGGNTPDLVAAFADGKYKDPSATTTFNDLFTFSRSSTATYVDSSGTFQTASSGEARTGHHIYDGSTWVNEGLLLESEARTNSLLDNRDASTANWSGTATSTQDAVGIDGVANSASTISDNSSGSVDSKSQDVTVPADTNTHICYWFIKKDSDETRYPELTIAIPGVVGQSSTLNTSTGVITAQRQTGGTVEVVDFGDWWKVISTITNNGTGTAVRFQISPAHNSDGTASPDATAIGSVIYDMGQVEINTSTPSSPIPTTGSTATRAAETLSIAAAKLPYSSTAMSIAMEGTVTYADDDDFGRFVFWFENTSNYIDLFLDWRGALTGKMRFEQSAGGTNDFVQDTAAYSPGINVPFNIASRHTSSDINGAVDGTALTADTTPTALPDLSATDLDLGTIFNGTIKTFRMWDLGLTDAELEEATA